MGKQNTSKGIGFVGALQIVFIVLKLCKVISWSWLWVLSPIWINVIVLFILLAILGILEYLDK